MTDHAGCQKAYEVEKARANFAEARLAAVLSELHALGHLLDRIDGHTSHPALGGKTLGGAARTIAQGGSL